MDRGGGVCRLGLDAALLAPAQGGARDADHCPSRAVERGAGMRMAGLQVRTRVAARDVGVAARRADAGADRRADRVQLGALHLGGQRGARGRNRIGVFHQPAVQRGSWRGGAAGTAEPRAVDRHRDGQRGRVVADVQLRKFSVDRHCAGGLVRRVWTGAQAHRRAARAWARGGEPVPAVARPGVPRLGRGERPEPHHREWRKPGVGRWRGGLADVWRRADGAAPHRVRRGGPTHPLFAGRAAAVHRADPATVVRRPGLQ